MNFFKLIKHKFIIILWLLKRPKNSLDYTALSFASLAARWRGEIYPVLSYIGMFEVLRQNKFKGNFLELGGGYSTILAQNFFGENVIYRSVDVYPKKYYRILNSISATNSFLNNIERIDRLTVPLADANISFKKIKHELSHYNRNELELALQKFCKSKNGRIDYDSVMLMLKLIFEDNYDSLTNFYKEHPSYKDEISFYNDYKNDIGFCNEIRDSNLRLDAVFYDCGEISSIAEWYATSELIPVGGYALFHDIFFPKSIKNFLLAVNIYLSDDWKILYLDDVSEQGALLAERITLNAE